MNHVINHRISEAHADMDDTAEFAMTRRCNGLDYQGRYPIEAASACTEIGADGGPPDVWESADGEVLLILAKAFGAMAALVFTIWMFQP